jgi:hypothetical protein
MKQDRMFSLLLILIIGCAALVVANLVSQARPPAEPPKSYLA